MKQLTDERSKILLEKLSKYIGGNTTHLLDRPDGTYLFREHKNRVYYVSENILKQASNVNPEKLVSIGVCIGKFTKTQKFRLHITSLHYIAPYALYKIWVKPNAEQQVLYGHNVLKSGLAKITESTPQYQGVIIYSMNDVPLGFGVTAKSTADCKNADPLTVICFNQSDIGEYIRCEDELL
uniref:60S ribosome subunit biogenesis protein NIP7 homolog n=1 Tax=Maconellicoccus hirsutus TaxID=177089 RepID=A2I462_MACHI|nr:putative 60S ribosome subunit biogenesis protein NIP7-like protein [Maconellicoccus hirsutus]